MSIELLHVVITLSLIGGLTLGGLLYSYLMISRGLWGDQRYQEKKRAEGTYLKSMPIIFTNLALYSALTGLGLYYFHDIAIGESFFGLSMPLPVQVALEVAVLLIIDDFYFYFLHRLIHESKFLYRTVHIVHHKNQRPMAAEYIYTHPVEWLLGILGPLLAILLMQGVTFWAWCGYLVARTLHELIIHSGVKSSRFLRLIPFYGTNEHHGIHHSHFECNYAATFTIWDKVFKTQSKG